MQCLAYLAVFMQFFVFNVLTFLISDDDTDSIFSLFDAIVWLLLPDKYKKQVVLFFFILE